MVILIAFSHRLTRSSLRSPTGNDVGVFEERKIGGGEEDTGEKGDEYACAIILVAISGESDGVTGVEKRNMK